MNSKKDQIIDDVMNQIKGGKVRMKPAIYFSILSAVSIVASLVAGVAMSYVSSIIFFWFKISNINGNAYGPKANLDQLITSFPWWAVIIFVGLIVFIVYIVRRFGTVYRYKARNIVLVVIIASMIIGLVLSSLGIGDLNSHMINQQNQFNGSGRRK